MRKGFTLVELAIVLVVIGLLAAGVMAGRDLIKNSEIRSVAAEIEDLKTAFHNYKLTYDALPGDHARATSYWGVVVGSCTTVAGTGTQTCNGDGDRIIDYVHSAYANTLHESWRAWQHLTNAEMIKGEYSGISITGCTVTNHCTDPGKNAPKSKIAPSAAWHVFHLNAVAAGFRGKAESRDVLWLGDPKNKDGANRDGMMLAMAITTMDQYKIDLKMDDGLPSTGAMTDANNNGTAVGTLNPNCSFLTGGRLEYKLAYEDIDACNLLVDLW